MHRDFLSCSRGLAAWLDEHMLENLAVKRECQKLIATTEHLSFSYLGLANFSFPFGLLNSLVLSVCDLS